MEEGELEEEDVEEEVEEVEEDEVEVEVEVEVSRSSAGTRYSMSHKPRPRHWSTSVFLAVTPKSDSRCLTMKDLVNPLLVGGKYENVKVPRDDMVESKYEAQLDEFVSAITPTIVWLT